MKWDPAVAVRVPSLVLCCLQKVLGVTGALRVH